MSDILLAFCPILAFILACLFNERHYRGPLFTRRPVDASQLPTIIRR